jgi:hypothetical protein
LDERDHLRIKISLGEDQLEPPAELAEMRRRLVDVDLAIHKPLESAKSMISARQTARRASGSNGSHAELRRECREKLTLGMIRAEEPKSVWFALFA